MVDDLEKVHCLCQDILAAMHDWAYEFELTYSKEEQVVEVQHKVLDIIDVIHSIKTATKGVK